MLGVKLHRNLSVLQRGRGANKMALLLRQCVRKSLCRNQVINLCRSLKTTTKNKETVTAQDIATQKGPETVEDFINVKKQKNWVSYGFDYESKEQDLKEFKSIFFWSITVVLVGVTYIFMYIPDVKNADWATREAFLELHRREKLGLPLIDRNYISPDKIPLPSEEELEGVEIII